jgi:hypothetical protein
VRREKQVNKEEGKWENRAKEKGKRKTGNGKGEGRLEIKRDEREETNGEKMISDSPTVGCHLAHRG